MITPIDEKWLWAMRHGDNILNPNTRKHGTWQKASPLYPEGCGEIVVVREQYLQDTQFTQLWHSPFVRAVETAQILVPTGNWIERAELAPVLVDEMDNIFRTVDKEQQPTTLEQLEVFLPGCCEKFRIHILASAGEMLDLLKLGESGIFVSHQPMLGLLRGALDKTFPPLQQDLPKGGGYRFRFDERNTLLGVDELLPPVKQKK